MKRFFLLLVLGLPALVGRAQQAELAALLARAQVPGMQVVYAHGRARTTYCLGVRQAGATQPVDARTVFQAASLGKVVLAYVALRLYDRGLLDLDQPLLRYGAYPRLVPDPRASGITARRVLAHTSGLPNWASNPLEPGWKTSALRLTSAPDSCWSYSGEGFVLLQRALEQVSGQPFEVLARREVFRPLGMRRSSFVWQSRFAADASAGHDGQGQPTPPRHFAEAYGAYSLLTTAPDYSCFLQAVAAGRGLQPATARLLTTPATPADRCGHPATAADAAVAWACGVGLAATSRGPALWHWGDNGDFKGFFMVLPASQESVLVLTNSSNGPRLVDDVLRLFFGPGTYWATQWLAE